MTILDVIVDGKKKPLYIDGEIHYQITNHVKPSVEKKDFDWVIAIDGEEGSGKSVFAFQIAKILDPDLNLSQIAFTPEQFIQAVTKAKQYSCIVYDECGTGLSARASLSETSRLLVSLMMEMRQKNLFVILVMPTFYMLDRYCVLHRCKGLFHVYLNENGKRGQWLYWNKKRMKYLYLKGRKFYEYHSSKYLFFGKFQNQYMVNEIEYKKRKKVSLEEKSRITKADMLKQQRDTLFSILNLDLNINQLKIVKLCKDRGFSVERSTISKIISSIEKKEQKNVNFKPENSPNTANGYLKV